LVGVGLIETHPNGWAVHDWDDFQQSKEQRDSLRRKRQVAGRIGGRAKAEKDKQLAMASAMANVLAPVMATRHDIQDLQDSSECNRADTREVGSAYERFVNKAAPNALTALCAVHSTACLVEAIERAAKADKPTVAYIGAIAKNLTAEGWTPEPVLTSEPDPFAGL
jgi:hypothetical protein